MFAGVRICWLVIPQVKWENDSGCGMALYYLEHHPLASIPVAASSKEQADTLYRQAEGFVMRTPRLSAASPDEVLEAKGLKQVNTWQRKEVPRFQCQEGVRRIKFYAGGTHPGAAPPTIARVTASSPPASS